MFDEFYKYAFVLYSSVLDVFHQVTRGTLWLVNEKERKKKKRSEEEGREREKEREKKKRRRENKKGCNL